MKNKKVLWIARTAMYLALCVACQTVLRMFLTGITQVLVVGSLVNLFLIASTVTDGFWSGFCVSVAAPVIAFLQGHLPPLVPFMILVVALGNIAIVAMVSLYKPLYRKTGKEMFSLAFLMVAGSVLKFAVLMGLVRLLVIPYFVNSSSAIPEKAKTAMTATFNLNFSWPQLVTALAGSVIFFVIFPAYKQIMKNNK